MVLDLGGLRVCGHALFRLDLESKVFVWKRACMDLGALLGAS